MCALGYGCVFCVPRQRQCDGDQVIECNGEGSDWNGLHVCENKEGCYNGFCGSPCSQAEADLSYEGCRYISVPLMNSQVSSDFAPAVVISNRSPETAIVTVRRAGSVVAEVDVASDSSRAIELSWIEDLKQEYGQEQSINVPWGVYTIESTMPVTVYQFNPLEYRLDHNCSDSDLNPLDGWCFSYSNDASLLLPTQVLTEHYMVMSRPTLGIHYDVFDDFLGTRQDYYSFSPSILAVANPHDHEISVTVTFSSPTQAGPTLMNYNAGDRADFVIGSGGVLQIAAHLPDECIPDWVEPESVPWGDGLSECFYGYCSLPHLDLTGTEISASDPVAVFGGHNCDFIPYNRWACDHLEEQLFPYETWGKHFVLNQSHRENNEPDVFRVLSGADGNVISFEPEVFGRATLDRGEFIEFEAHGAFEVSTTEPVMVGQFIVGQNYNAFDPGDEDPPGDPAFSLAVPVEQYRNTYNFLAPTTYDQSYINITTAASELGMPIILLDGRDLSDQDWQPIGQSGYTTLRLAISAGSHSMTSAPGVTFGITVYGYGQYTSYMYPGGLDLEQIAVW